MQKISTLLWFDGKAEEAAKFYISVFKKGKIIQATIMSVTFELFGQTFLALNGGPAFKFTPAISLFVSCKTQKEVDTLWSKLTKGGKESRCGWLEDKYGLSWQIIPDILGTLLNDKAKRAINAMMGMSKIDVAALKAAAAGTALRSPKNTTKVVL